MGSFGKDVIQGTCGFSDTTLVDCGRFYPRKGLTAPEKLAIYSRKGLFGCVEIDSSNYTILRAEHAECWVKATPPGFIFHFKAYGLLTNGGMQFKALPRDIREAVGEHPPTKYITLQDIGEEKLRNIWDRFHESLRPVVSHGRLGAVVFQFQLNVVPSGEAREHVEYCARNLRPDLRMAVEFRNRDWLNEANLSSTVQWLSGIRPGGAALISCDDLASEVYATAEASAGLGGDHLPIVLSSQSFAEYAYVRVHRRVGEERLLSEAEIGAWAERITDLYERKGFEGCLFFLWGTDWEDQPMINAQRLAKALPPAHAPQWAERVKTNDKQSIRSMFAKAASSASSTEVNAESLCVKKASLPISPAAPSPSPAPSPLKPSPTPNLKKRPAIEMTSSAAKVDIMSFFKIAK